MDMEFAVVLPDGEIYLQEKGKVQTGILNKYDRNTLCDITNFVQEYFKHKYNKEVMCKKIQAYAQSFYSPQEKKGIKNLKYMDTDETVSKIFINTSNKEVYENVDKKETKEEKIPPIVKSNKRKSLAYTESDIGEVVTHNKKDKEKLEIMETTKVRLLGRYTDTEEKTIGFLMHIMNNSNKLFEIWSAKKVQTYLANIVNVYIKEGKMYLKEGKIKDLPTIDKSHHLKTGKPYHLVSIQGEKYYVINVSEHEYNSRIAGKKGIWTPKQVQKNADLFVNAVYLDGKLQFATPDIQQKALARQQEQYFDIQDHVLIRCKINRYSISIPETVLKINTKAFEFCDKVKEINIPSTVMFVEQGALNDCVNLRAINVAEDNPVYTSIEGVLYTKDKSMLCCYTVGRVAEEYTIAKETSIIKTQAFKNSVYLKKLHMGIRVKEIQSESFEGCKSLEEMFLSSEIYHIGDRACKGCLKLREFTIPSKCISLGTNIFQGCVSLSNIQVADGNLEYLAIEGALHRYNAEKKFVELVYVPSNIPYFMINDRVKSIDKYAFLDYNANRYNVSTTHENYYNTLDGFVLDKDNHTLVRCPHTKMECVIPQEIGGINKYAFYNCQMLVEVTLHKNVQYIADSAFLNCYALRSITIPATTKLYGKCIGFQEVDNNIIKLPDFTIKGVKGTDAERYAIEHGFYFVAVML